MQGVNAAQRARQVVPAGVPMSIRTMARQTKIGTSAVLHGRHPLRGYAVTWHLTPLPATGHGPTQFLVERADGTITDDLVWHLAEKDAVVMTTHEMCDLVRKVAAQH